MKSLVLIALVVILGTQAVQGYGPGGPRGGPPGHWGGPHGGPPPGHGWGRGGPGGGPHGWGGRGGPGGGPHGGGWPHRPGFHRPGWHDSEYDSDYDGSDSDDSDYGDYGHHTKPTIKPPTTPPTTTKEPITTTQKRTTTTEKPTTTTQKPTTTTEKPTTITQKPTTTTQKPTTTTETTTPSIQTCPTIMPCDCEKTTKSIPETTPSNPEPETTTAEGEITPHIEACINSCHSTPEYNPVCGSNGITYDNEGKLFCAKSCGVKVTLRRKSVCPPPTWDDSTTTSGTLPPTITEAPPVGRTTSLSDFQRCMRLCAVTPSFTPVCGTDFVTYMNVDRLKCAQKCGQDVKVLCEKPCAACGITPGTTKTTTTITTTTFRPTTTPQIGRSTLTPDVQKCVKTCPVTPEYNPVCGSDHVTYSNPSRLLCAQLCGTGVSITRMGPCGSTTTTSTTVAPPSTRSPAVLACIRRCPVTSEYDPVCGTDGLTYTNLGNLQCSKYCGVAVDFRHKSRCVDEFDLGGDGTTEDVNGYKDLTTTTPYPTTSSVFTSPITTTTPKSISTTKAGPNSSTTLGFTIPDDVLNDIFGSTTTHEPVTKPKNPDEDEDLDLDTRNNNKSLGCLMKSVQAALSVLANGIPELGINSLAPFIVEKMNWKLKDNIMLHSTLKLGSKVKQDGQRYLDLKSSNFDLSYDGRVSYDMMNLSPTILDSMNSNWKTTAEKYETPIVKNGINSVLQNLWKLFDIPSIDKLKKL